jgi:hypothetical protein
MTAPALRFGHDSQLYVDVADSWDSPSWTLINNVSESVEVKPQYESTESTTRGTNVATEEPTLVGVELSWTMLEDVGDAVFLALRTAFWTKAPLQILTCSAAYTTSGEVYVRGDFKIHGFEKSEPVKGINTYKLTLKPSNQGNAFTTGMTPIGSGGLG